MTSSFILVRGSKNEYPQYYPIQLEEPPRERMTLTLHSTENFVLLEKVEVFEEKKQYQSIDYMIPRTLTYKVTSINDTSIALDRITEHDDWRTSETVIQMIQRQVPGAEGYLRDYNERLALQVLKQASTATLITTVGGVIHTDTIRILTTDNHKIVSEIKISPSLVKHLKYANTGKIVLNLRDTVEKYYAQVKITRLVTTEERLLVHLDVTTFTYGKQTNLEKFEFSRWGISLSHFVKTQVRYWFYLLRVPFFTLTLFPILLANIMVVFTDHQLNIVNAILTIIGLFLVQSGANLLNDYFDYLSQTDEFNLFSSLLAGDTRFIRDRLLLQSYSLLLGSSLLLFGGIIGVYLNFATPGHLVLILGLTGGFMAYFYSAQPLKFAYRGVGELLMGITFGPLVMIGVFYVQVPKIEELEALLLLSLPIGFFLTTIILLNSFQKLEIDELSKKKTIVVRLGKRITSMIIVVLLILAQMLIALIHLLSSLPSMLMVLVITIPLSIVYATDLMKNYNDIFRIRSIMLRFILLYFLAIAGMGVVLLSQ